MSKFKNSHTAEQEKIVFIYDKIRLDCHHIQTHTKCHFMKEFLPSQARKPQISLSLHNIVHVKIDIVDYAQVFFLSFVVCVNVYGICNKRLQSS